MGKIHGITITLLSKTQTGVNALGEPVYTIVPIQVNNVIVAPATSQEILDIQTLTGKKITLNLGIPKGDTNVWEDRDVVLPAPFDGTYHTVAYMQTGITDLVPLDWDKKIAVEKYG